MNITEKIIVKHLAAVQKAAAPSAGENIAIRIDQTLTQDATGTLAYLQFESIGRKKVAAELAVSYVDHNTLQTGFENADDHLFLRTFAAKYGIIFSPPGNGICHHLHLENFTVPGKTLLGSDSHTPTAGAVGMLAMGAGGLDVAAAMAGEPFNLEMPYVVNIRLIGKLKPWCSAKDIILYLLKKFSVKGGVKKVFEYSGPALKTLSVPERSVITNMGAELGLTSSVFPSDEVTRSFMKSNGREKQWKALSADPGASYFDVFEIDLTAIEPLVADEGSPDNVKSVKELEGTEINQVCIGSCTNSSFRDLQAAAEIIRKYGINPGVDLFISPGSRRIVSMLDKTGALSVLVGAGARILEPACGPCIGMGCSPPTGGVTVRTFNRNFPGRSGTKSARVILASAETAAASAASGKITDPRKFGKYPAIKAPVRIPPARFVMPPKTKSARAKIEIVRGPNIKPLPIFAPLPDGFSAKVAIKLTDNVSTDDILPAGAKILPLRSNIPAISEFAFSRVDPAFAAAAKESAGRQLIVVAGENYGQGSSREHAAIAPRYLGVAAVLAKSFARIHLANLINSGILPLTFENPADYGLIERDDEIALAGGVLRETVAAGGAVRLKIASKGAEFAAKIALDERQKKIILAGGLLNYIKESSAKDAV